MVVWISERFQQDMEVAYGLCHGHGHAPLSQDNVLHSVLGVLDVVTRVQKRELGILDTCRIPYEVSAK